MEHYIKDCVWNFCVINRYVNKYFHCFPPEVINVINYKYITIYGHIDKLPFTCDKPGTYIITKDWDFYDTTSAIDIISDNVNIDLQGHTITNHNSYATIYVKDIDDVCIENGFLKSNYTSIYVTNSSVFIDNLKIIDQPNVCLSGEIGKTGDIGTCDRIKPISSQTRKYHHTVYNKKLFKNIPKNVKQCKRNKYH
jgi:hypothetical protein